VPAPATAPHLAAGVRQSSRVVAVGAVVLVTLDLDLVDALTTAIVVPLALLPVWWSATRRFVGARTLLALVALALVAGLWLSAHASATHTVNPTYVREHVLLVAGGFAAVGTLLWARTVLPVRAVALAAAGGLLMRLALTPVNPANPWKYNYSYAVTVLALALVIRRRPRPAEVVILLGLAVVCTLNDSRSAFATLVLAALLVAWQLRPRTLGRHANAVTTIALFGGVAACVYTVGTTLILEGYLGESTQQRSVEQLETSGSLLLGGRPEWGATAALVAERPHGYGIGVRAGPHDVLVAKTGMSSLHYDPHNGYVENYMFGGEIKLHAVVADLWSRHGVAGVLLSAWLLGLAVWSLASATARRVASGLTIYLTCLMLWNFAFGPIQSSMPILVLALGLLLLPRAGVDAGHATLEERPA